MDQEPREQLDGGRVKGVMLRSHVSWVRDHRPPEDLDLLWKTLPDEISNEISDAVLATSWYPFEWLVILDRTIVELFGEGDVKATLAELGRYSAKINLGTTYKVFDRNSNHEFFANSALLHRQFQDFGRFVYEKTGETSGRAKYHEYTCYSPVFCASSPGYFEQCILSHGATNAKVVETECRCLGAETCTFEMTWE